MKLNDETDAVRPLTFLITGELSVILIGLLTAFETKQDSTIAGATSTIAGATSTIARFLSWLELRLKEEERGGNDCHYSPQGERILLNTVHQW
jgi:hypothetical protein